MYWVQKIGDHCLNCTICTGYQFGYKRALTIRIFRAKLVHVVNAQVVYMPEGLHTNPEGFYITAPALIPPLYSNTHVSNPRPLNKLPIKESRREQRAELLDWFVLR
jgi:hypothetical protein